MLPKDQQKKNYRKGLVKSIRIFLKRKGKKHLHGHERYRNLPEHEKQAEWVKEKIILKCK